MFSKVILSKDSLHDAPGGNELALIHLKLCLHRSRYVIKSYASMLDSDVKSYHKYRYIRRVLEKVSNPGNGKNNRSFASVIVSKERDAELIGGE